MMKDLNNYREISNKELQEIKGGFGVGVGIALFMAGYTIGKDLWQLIPLGKISVKSLVSHAR